MSSPVEAIPIIQTGFSWTAAGAWASFFALLAVLVRTWPVLTRIRSERDGKIDDILIGRIDAADAEIKELKADRAECERRTRSLQAQVDGLMRQLIQFQLTLGSALPPTSRSPEIDEMLENLKRIVPGGDK